MYWPSAVFGKNMEPKLQPFSGHRLKVLLMLVTMAQSPASYLIQMHGYMSFFRQWIYGVGMRPKFELSTLLRILG